MNVQAPAATLLARGTVIMPGQSQEESFELHEGVQGFTSRTRPDLMLSAQPQDGPATAVIRDTGGYNRFVDVKLHNGLPFDLDALKGADVGLTWVRGDVISIVDGSQGWQLSRS